MKRSLLICGLLAATAAEARADNWPQWRGPNFDGISKEKNIPAEWSDTTNVLWKLPMPGVGSSTPAVWSDRIFLTSQDGDNLVLMCVGTDGKERWKKSLGPTVGGPGRNKGDEGNNASASPATDGKHVWALVGTGELACFDLDGKEVWRFNLQQRYGKFRIGWGFHNTPMLYNDRLYLALFHGGSDGQQVVALDKATGNEVWKRKRDSDGRGECLDAYTTPTVWRKGGDALLVVHGNDYTTGHRLADGDEVWRLGDLNSKERYNATFRLVASPVAVEDLIVVPTAKNGPVVGLKPDAKGMVRAGDKSEQWRMPKNTPDVPSPLVVDGLVYLCRENGNLTCLDARTGTPHYAEERTHNARHRASPVFVDGKVILTARDGTYTVVKHGPKFEKLATNKLGEDVTASPAFADGKMYLRGWKTLYAVGQAK